MYGTVFASICTPCNYQWRMAMSICPSLKFAMPLWFAVQNLINIQVDEFIWKDEVLGGCNALRLD
jgi:hypothetical protein